MKTRSNMPLFVVECEDVKALSNAQIDLLRCGDYLVKKDASGEHAYKVTFKSDTGMCITYHDASVIETQSYDKIDGVWTYNSEDKTPNLLEIPSDEHIKDIAEDLIINADSGTPVEVLGINADDHIVLGAVGAKTYIHRVELYKGSYSSRDKAIIVWTDTTENHNFSSVSSFINFINGKNIPFNSLTQFELHSGIATGFINNSLLKLNSSTIATSPVTKITYALSYYKQDTDKTIVFGGDISLEFSNQNDISYDHYEL